MIIRNGIRSIFRARKLCILFLLLTGVLSLVLNLGIGVYMSASGTLASFRETYRSVGRIEYIGPDYPDETAYDPFAVSAYEDLDLNGIRNTPGVIYAEKKNFTLGFADGFKRHRNTIPFKDYGVLLVNSLHALDETPVDVPLEGMPDFPDTYLLINAVTRSLSIHQGESTEELPAYVYSYADGTFTENVYENGEFTQIVRHAGEIAKNYVLITPEADRIVYSGSLDPEDHSIPRYVYDPLSGRYSSQIWRVSEYTAIFNDALYSRKVERKILIRLKTGALDFVPEEKHRYAVHGSFIDGGTSNLVFEVREFSDDPDFPILDVTDMDSEALNSSVFGAYAEKYRTANNYLNVYSSRDVSLLEPFHQGWLTLETGRFPGKFEEGVCVIDRSLADQLKLSIGDRLPVSLLHSEQSDIYRFQGTSDPREFEIIGITAENNDYEGEVFISQQEPFDTGFFGSQIGYVLFENENARISEENVRSLLAEGMRITLYDQGYETNSEPLKALLGVSSTVTAIASLAAAASLVLFAFLYIYRQSETLAILHDLGLKNRGIREWILSGVLSVVLIGSLAGSFCGGLLQSLITSLTLKGTAGFYASDTRFSEAAVGLNKTAEIILPDPLRIASVCIGAILLAACILSLFFLAITMRQARPRKGVQKISVPEMKTSVKGKGILRYGRIGFERGGKRSAAVILICFVLSLLLCGFAAVDTSRHKEIETLYENTEISGSIVSLNGKYSNGLVISENLVRRFNQSGMVASFHVSYGRSHWWRKGEMPYFANTSYGEESREAWIGKQPKLIFTDSLEAAEDLPYVPEMIEWKEGYDESFFAAEYPPMNDCFVYDQKTRTRIMVKPIPALVPREYLKDAWTETGEIEIESDSGTLKLIPAGVYSDTSRRPGIYLPLTLIYDLNRLYEEPDDSRSYYLPETVFTSGSFTLKSAYDLHNFKDFLEKNRYSAVNHPAYDRTTVLLYDGAFLDTLNTLNRNLSFIRMIYPVLMGFTVLTGFLISWLMINGRRMDFAVMKGLGTGRMKIFLIFFLEQAYAAVTGILPVLILSFFISKPVIILLFAVSYLLGTALSIQLASRENLMVLLSEKE